MNASQRRAVYVFGGAVTALATIYGIVTKEQAIAWLGLVGAGTSLYAAFKAADPAAVVTKDGETVAGSASSLPAGTPVEVEPVPDDEPVLDGDGDPVTEGPADADEDTGPYGAPPAPGGSTAYGDDPAPGR